MGYTTLVEGSKYNIQTRERLPLWGAKRKVTDVITYREGTQDNKAMASCCWNNRGRKGEHGWKWQ